MALMIGQKPKPYKPEVGLEEGAIQWPIWRSGEMRGRRDQITKGIGQWFGAFDEDRIVTGWACSTTIASRSIRRNTGGDMELVDAAALAPCCAGGLGITQMRTLSLWLKADTDAPGRLYRKMGFTHAETIWHSAGWRGRRASALRYVISRLSLSGLTGSQKNRTRTFGLLDLVLFQQRKQLRRRDELLNSWVPLERQRGNKPRQQ
jgi:hypothetical protein